MNIPENIRPRLEKSIRELLLAGRTCSNIASVLGANQSFGKYDGCTPDAIRRLADTICSQLSRECRQTVNELLARPNIKQTIQDYPALRRVVLTTLGKI